MARLSLQRTSAQPPDPTESFNPKKGGVPATSSATVFKTQVPEIVNEIRQRVAVNS